MTHTLILPAELTIYVVAELRTPWLDWLQSCADDGAEVSVDASEVEEIDGAGMQCLMSLARSLAARGQRMVLQPCPEIVRQACQRLGAAKLLEQPEGAPA